MSRFFSTKYDELEPYVPGEQPQGRTYVKLNTNESPFPPASAVVDAVAAEAAKLQLYSDPECRELRAAASRVFNIGPDNIVFTNGSDDALNFAFMAFADESHPLVFADITYGFYPVFARLNNIPFSTIPLREDFTIDPADYCDNRADYCDGSSKLTGNETVVIANPNAPTGLALPRDAIKMIVENNPDRIVIVDEAYVDFGGESTIELTKTYKNLLVVGTFSKSRNMAGSRLGFAIGDESLIADLNTLRYSTNPYNINRMTAVAGVATFENDAYYRDCWEKIIRTRTWTTKQLEARGFVVLPSSTNFVFARTDALSGEEVYRGLKERGVLVRHFTGERISDFNRISIGTDAEMETLLAAIDDMLG